MSVDITLNTMVRNFLMIFFKTSKIRHSITRFLGLDFVTVRGSGHFVPQDKPREALQMIYNYVHQLDYSTPVPVSTQPQPLING